MENEEKKERKDKKGKENVRMRKEDEGKMLKTE